MRATKRDIYLPEGCTEVEVAAEVCVRILNSDLLPRTPQTVAKLAMATGIPVDRIRQAWAMAPARNVPLDRTPVNDAETLPEPVRPSRRAEPVKIHRGKPRAKPKETSEERFARRAQSKDHEQLLRKEPEPGMRRCDGKLCRGELRPFAEFVKKGESFSSWCRACIKVYQSERYLTSKRIAKLGPVLEFVLAEEDEHVGMVCPDCNKPCEVGETVLAGVLTMRHASHYEKSES